MYCRKCGCKNDDDARFCVQCGEMLQERELVKERNVKRKKWNWRKTTVSLPLILAIVVFLIFFSNRKIKYDSIEIYDEYGLAKVELDGRFGCINEKGKVVIPVKYGDIVLGTANEQSGICPLWADGNLMFTDLKGNIISNEIEDSGLNGYYIVKKGKDYGCISETGEVILPFEYKDIKLDSIYDEKIKVELDGRVNYITLAGGILYDSVEQENEYGWSFARKDNKCGYINEQGKEIIPVQYNSVTLGTPQENGYALLEMDDTVNFVNANGDLLYTNVSTFGNNNLAAACDSSGNYGFIDKSGKAVTEFCYTYAEEFNEDGYAFVRIGKIYNFVSLDGTEKFEYMGEFVNGTAIAKLDGQYGLVDRSGKLLTDGWYDRIYEDASFREAGLARAKKQGEYVLLDSTGREVSNYYDGIYDTCDDSIIAWKSNRYGLLDLTGKEIASSQFVDVSGSTEGYKTATDENGEKLIIRADGEIIFRGQYEQLDTVKYNGVPHFLAKNEEGYRIYTETGESVFEQAYEDIDILTDKDGVYFAVKKDGKFAIVNVEEEPLTNYVYDDIGMYRNAEKYGGLFIAASKDGYWGVIDKNGRVIVDFAYTGILSIPDDISDYIIVQDIVQDEWEFYGCFDATGSEVLPCLCQSLRISSNGADLLEVESGDKYGVFGHDHNWVIPMEYNYIISDNNGYFRVCEEGAFDFYYGIFDREGNEILPTEYNYIDYSFDLHNGVEDLYTLTRVTKECRRPIRQGNYYGVVNENYEVVIPFEYTDIYMNINNDFTCIAEAPDGTYSLIDKNGKILISDAKSISNTYDSLFDGTGLYFVSWLGKEEQYDVYDYCGHYQYTLNYEEVEGFQNGLAAVCLNGKYGFVNTKGELVIDCIYNDAGEGFLADEIAAVAKDTGWGCINGKGEQIVDFIYSDVEISDYGWIIATDSNGKKGLFSTSGQLTFPVEYDDIEIDYRGIVLTTGNIERIVNEVGYVLKEETVEETEG